MRAIGRAWGWRQQLERGDVATLADLAADEGLSDRYVSRLLRLAWLVDKLSRQIDTLDGDLAVLGETVAQFIHYWMTITPPLPDAARQSARAKAAERFEGFMQNLGRRLATGDRFLKELSRDVSGDEALGLAAEPQTVERGT